MAKEYIEREAAKMAVVEALGKGYSPFNAIVMLPAADVVPVRHGHWIQREDNDGALIIPFVSCSSCHYDWDFETTFCPNCGARMDGDGDV